MGQKLTNGHSHTSLDSENSIQSQDTTIVRNPEYDALLRPSHNRSISVTQPAVIPRLDNHAIRKSYTTKLTGKLESHFGIALANIGDLNKDNCDDIAIGAPYEGDGVVYIHLGSREGLSAKPSQVIMAKELGLLNSPIDTFGSSLSGGIDLDSNSYPDLLVGAYGSSAAVALLARPITNIKTEVSNFELKNIDPSKQGCTSDPGTNLTCFSDVFLF